MRDVLEEREYATTKPAGISRTSILGPDLVLVNRASHRFKKDGSLLEERASYYLVSRSSGKWKIAGSMPQTAVFAGQAY
jgi:hypothetical protein